MYSFIFICTTKSWCMTPLSKLMIFPKPMHAEAIKHRITLDSLNLMLCFGVYTFGVFSKLVVIWCFQLYWLCVFPCFSVLFSLLAMVVYLVLFFQYYKKSILQQDEQALGFVTQVELDFSFYMLMSTVLLFTINMAFLFLTGIKFSCGFTREAEKVMDNGIILY